MGMLLSALGWAQFSDVPQGHWAREAIEQLANEGLLYGFPEGTFRPDGQFSRAQAAVTLWRLILQYRLKDLRELTREDIERLKGLLAAVKALQEGVEEARQGTNTLADRLTGMEGRLASLRDELSSLAGKGVEAGEEALRQLQEAYARLSGLEGLVYKALKDQREELSALAGALRDLDAKVKALEEAWNQAREGDRRTLEERWNALSSSLSQAASKVAALEASLGKVGELEKNLAALERRVTSLEEGLKTLREEVRKLREEVPRVRKPKPFGVGLYLSGLSSGFGVGEYVTSGGFSVRLLGALGNPGPYLSGSLGYRHEGEGVGYRIGLGLGRGFFGPGFTYGEGSFGLKVDLLSGLSLVAEGVYSYPLGSGPIVSRFGVGVMYQW